jgi:hypothetical protein
VHVEKFFARNLGGLIHARTRVPGRLGKATSRTPSMYVDEKSDEAIVLAKRLNKELSLKVGDGGNREGGISWGCLTPPLLHRRSDMPCPRITSSS